jgi:hypothetical protein
MTDDIKAWLEANLFLSRNGAGYAVTELGKSWLAFNSSLSTTRTPS